MKNVAWQFALKTLLPPLLGALGALAATAVPAYHAAFCSVSGGSLPPGLY